MDVLSTQISQLREEMHSGFSTLRDGLRAEIREGDDRVMEHVRELYFSLREENTSLRVQIQGGDEETRRSLREEIRAGDEETRRVLREEIRAGDEETRRVLREEIRAGDERVMNHARMLYEDLKADLAKLHEAWPRRRRPRK